MTKGAVPVYLEVGTKRIFAGAVDWPGWCRSGRSEQDALDALMVYADRYASVAGRARVAFAKPSGTSSLEVVERVPGTPTTEFGAPGVPPASDKEPMNDKELNRQTRLLVASWATFDSVARKAKGVRLQTGPRGGGRSLAKIIDHVREADEAYLGGLGAKPPKPLGTDPAGSSKRLRAAMLDALAAAARGEPFAEPRNTKKPWSPRYVVRRSAWHALDHAWEIEDRSRPDAAG